MNGLPDEFTLESPALRLHARGAPWDTGAFGFPVAYVRDIEVIDPQGAGRECAAFLAWLEAHGVRIASARLPHDRLRESMCLESIGFRFIEMVLHPVLDNLRGLDIPADSLRVEPAGAADLPRLQALAEGAFGHERYHVDPRLDPALGDRRYGRWVRNSGGDPAQRLLKITDGDRLVALFIVEALEGGSAYWHLTAVAPEWQGQGYGRRAWLAMLRHHQAEGRGRVSTTVSARNLPALNLYARLGFRYLPPEMTFHWVRGEA